MSRLGAPRAREAPERAVMMVEKSIANLKATTKKMEKAGNGNSQMFLRAWPTKVVHRRAENVRRSS